MTKLSKLEPAIEWLKQFELQDQEIVSQWLDSLRLVSADELKKKLIKKINLEAARVQGPVALYLEREVKKWNGVSQRAFEEKRIKCREKNSVIIRSIGNAAKIRPIAPQRTVDPEVGSEAIIANIATQLFRSSPNKFFIHPGPDLIRKHHISKAFILSDFIGSGQRCTEFLDSFWRLSTIKSWTSLRRFSFSVIAFSATEIGQQRVESHKSKPFVNFVAPCPTIHTEYSERDSKRLREIFIKYDPVDQNPDDSLGYASTAAMLVFSHGCPNNAPRILHKGKRRGKLWTPLFVGRSNVVEWTAENKFIRRLNLLGLSKQALAIEASTDRLSGQKLLLVMAALRSKPRLIETVALKCGLDIDQIEEAFEILTGLKWIDPNRRLTDEGHRHLAVAGKTKLDNRRPVDKLDDILYYPKSLRQPM